MASRYNPRSANGNFRRKMRQRLRARGDPCHICRGRLGPIHYDEPSDAAHPLSFVIDEVRPVSRWREFGYDSPEAAARDVENLAPAHWVCNAAKGAKVCENDLSFGSNFTSPPPPSRDVLRRVNVADGEW